MDNPSIVYLSDIQQLMKGGISSGTVDFFVRFVYISLIPSRFARRGKSQQFFIQTLMLNYILNFCRLLQHKRYVEKTKEVFIVSHHIWEMMDASNTPEEMRRRHLRLLPRDTILDKKILVIPVNIQWVCRIFIILITGALDTQILHLCKECIAI